MGFNTQCSNYYGSYLLVVNIQVIYNVSKRLVIKSLNKFFISLHMLDCVLLCLLCELVSMVTLIKMAECKIDSV